jgi:RNA polymerase sigma factor (sigma-70 family)
LSQRSRGNNIEQVSSHTLLQRASTGDDDAFARLLEVHAPELRRRMAPRIPQRYRSVIGIDDLMQQTFVDAYCDGMRIEPRGNEAIAAWLTVVAERNLVDAVRMLDAKKRGGDRRRINAARTRGDSWRDLIELLSASGSTPSRATAERETLDRLEKALRSLPETYRTVVEMCDLQDRPIDDISRELDRSSGAVYMLRARAHRMLAEILGETPDFSSDRREF